MSADCYSTCIPCQGMRRACWQQQNPFRTLISRTLSNVVVPDVAKFFWAESNRVYNYRKPRNTDHVLAHAGILANPSTQPFVCGEGRTHIGFRPISNHCPTTKISITKNLETGELNQFDAGTYPMFTHRVIYNLLMVDELVHLLTPIAKDPIAPVSAPIPVVQPPIPDVQGRLFAFNLHPAITGPDLEVFFQDFGMIMSIWALEGINLQRMVG